jgi:peptidoglycan/xylan/chitin deacetylase (PgdA/CDA1 family)
MMRSEQVRALHHAGMQIGAHTVSHPILANLPLEFARNEIQQSKQTLESLIGDRVGLFAYPNGVPGKDFTDQTSALVQELGFDCAVTTGWGVSRLETNVFQLPRFTPWDRTRMRFGLRMLQNLRTN